ncbi:MAG: cupin domain-containing protein [Bacteroidales bacterium]
MMKSNTQIRLTIVVSLLAASTMFMACNGQNETKDKPGEDKAKTSRNGVSTEDMGKKPWVLDIEETTIENENYRLANWTGENIQLVLMSIKPGDEIPLEMHDDHDQFIRIEKGKAHVRMGKSKDTLDFDETVTGDWAILIPAGYWHHIVNTGDNNLKLYTVYGPATHNKGTLHETAEEGKEHHH